jgi:hypothetical protein
VSGFLGRWSRRKRGEDLSEPAAAPPEPQVEPALPPDPAFDLESLPALDSLGAGSDLSSFLHPKVPELLRQAALRRVWAADPGIRDFVGPADYAWDFNAPNGVPGFSLELGGDIKKLLAQAIGEVTAPEEQPDAEPVPQDAPVLAAPTNPVRLTEAVLPEIVAIEEAEPEPPPLRMRRHGGALPVLDDGAAGDPPEEPPPAQHDVSGSGHEDRQG